MGTSADHNVDIDHHVKVYIRVFAVLAILTVVTVAASYLHLPLLIGVLVALFIACVKGSLVAGFFMHLFQEKKMIFWALILTVFFFFFLLLMPMLWAGNGVIVR